MNEGAFTILSYDVPPERSLVNVDQTLSVYHFRYHRRFDIIIK